MCFVIDPNAPKLKGPRKAYKVLKYSGSVLLSPHRHGTTWTRGKKVSVPGDAMTERYGEAAEGIYVLGSKADAIRYGDSWFNSFCVVECLVDGHLFSGSKGSDVKGRVSTFRHCTVTRVVYASDVLQERLKDSLGYDANDVRKFADLKKQLPRFKERFAKLGAK